MSDKAVEPPAAGRRACSHTQVEADYTLVVDTGSFAYYTRIELQMLPLLVAELPVPPARLFACSGLPPAAAVAHLAEEAYPMHS